MNGKSKKFTKGVVRSALVLVTLSLLFAQPSRAQTDTLNNPNKLEEWRARITLPNKGYLDVNMYIQWWNVVTLDYAGLEISPRYDMFIRRGRLGTSGRIHPKVFFNASFAYDGVGKDSLSAAAGVPNAEDNSTFFPRDILITYEFHKLLNITTGYFRPRAGKESIYSSSFVISQEKSWASFQPRIHMVGRGIGRETGINLGGLLQRKKISILYDVGFFDTNHPLIVGSNTVWSPLFTGRMVFMLGQPEITQYTLTYFQSGYGLRKGISFGVNGTYQKETELFFDNSVIGVDMQLNYGPLDFLVEYDWLYRKNRMDPTSDQYLPTTDRMLTLKAGWNWLRDNGRIWQIVAMFSNEVVDDRFSEQEFNPFTLAQTQYVWEAGVNYLIMRDKLKLGLHYFNGNRYRFGPLGNYEYVNASVQFMM